jgi:hypothetical protein
MRSTAKPRPASFLRTLLIAVVAGRTLAPLNAAELWVAPDGDDRHPGSANQPLQSLTTALRKAREWRRLKNPAVDDGVRIVLRGGVYPLNQTLEIRAEDSGTETRPTVIRAADGEKPILSGGLIVEGWEPVVTDLPGLPPQASGQVWIADAPVFHGHTVRFRQLWIGGRKAVRAREPDGPQMDRLAGWDRPSQTAWIHACPDYSATALQGAEMTLLQMWEIARLRLSTIVEEDHRLRLTFHEPESRLEFEHPWPQPVMEPEGAPFFLSGTKAFLDQPGEWYQDSETGEILYWPRADESLTRDTVRVPALETLVRVAGSLDRPVGHVTFDGIQFQHTTWMRPTTQGHVPLQAGMYLLEAYKLKPKGTPDWRSLDNQAWIGRPPAAVVVEGAHHIRFQRCRFERLASTGLDFVRGTHDDLIEGCLFRDVGGNGIQMGSFQEGSTETHLPYDPADAREVCARETIANNVVTDCGTEDWGCVGICVGYGREITIEHNEVFNLPYTGISLGWGWTRTPNAMRGNRVLANHIHQVATRMADTAGIYTLSAQPWTVISDNAIHGIEMNPYVHDPEHWFYLYLDEGSSFITVTNNWCPEERFLANANGPGNLWENNGPTVPESIRRNAGLQPAFRDLLDVLKRRND